MQEVPTITFRKRDTFEFEKGLNEHCTKRVLWWEEIIAGIPVSIDPLVRGIGLNLDDLPLKKTGSVRLYVYFANVFRHPNKDRFDSINEILESKTALEEKEFPKLRNHFVVQHGVELQIVTKQWQLPWTIEKDTFENLLKILEENQKDSSVLRKWYKADENSRTAHYVCEQTRNCSQNGGVSEWRDDEIQIEALIRYGYHNETDNALRNDLMLILVSDFKEVQAIGMEQDKTSPWKSVDPRMSRDPLVIELSFTVQSDGQNSLQDTLVVFGPNHSSMTGYRFDVQSFTCSVYDFLRRVIEETVQKRETSGMVHEILHHWAVAKSLNFVGRQDTLQLIREYIFGETVQPLVLTGESGTGKSAVMAQAAISAVQLLSDGDNRIQGTVMIRFCGRTYDSQRSHRLIASLAEQFLYAADRKPTGRSPWHQEAKQLLGDVLRNGDYRGLLVLFVDAINELASAKELDEFLDWLPARLANNVKVIVSCESEGQTLERLRQKITNQANIIQLDQLSVDQCHQLLNSLLQRYERKLTSDQWTLVEHALTHCQLPLYVHLIHDTVSRWTSFLDLPNQVLKETVEKCAVFKFKSLEETRGVSLTSNALGFLVAEPSGLSECEMEDLLSLNDDVLKEVSMAGDISSIRRCPSMTWIRFHEDLQGYLTLGQSGGLTVTRFAHRSLARVAETRYAKSPSLKTGLHSQIADYFLRASGMELPNAAKRETQKRSERGIPDAPLHFNLGGERSKPNYRKLDLLPLHLHHSGRFRELFDLVYFNFEWIYAKFVARSTQELLTDFQMVKDPEADMVAEAIALAEPTLSREPRLLGVELKGRLLAYHATHVRIRSLINQCDGSAVTLCPLVPVRTTFAAAGTALQRFVSISGVSCLTGFTMNENGGRLLLAQKAASDVRMRLWNVTSGERLADAVLTSGSEAFLSPDGKFGSVLKDDALRIYHLESGDLYAEVGCGPTGSLNCTASAGKYIAFSFDQAPGPAVVDIENGFFLRRLQYRSRSLAISHDLTHFACNSGETLAIHTFPLLERKATIVLPAVPEKISFSKEPRTLKIFAMLGDRTLQAVSFQGHAGRTQTLFQDFDLKDFKLSNNHDNLRILLCLSRSLYVLNTSSWNSPPRRLQMNHSTLDMEPSKAVLDGGFSMDDRLIVAVLGPYVGLWDACSTQLIRVSTFSDAPIVLLKSLETENAALTIGSDGFVCLWNLDRLTTERGVASTDRVIRGEVRRIAAAAATDRFICAGESECVLGSLNSEKFEPLVDSSNDFGAEDILEYVGISKSGNYAVTRRAKPGLIDAFGNHSPTPPGNSTVAGSSVVEREDVIWDLAAGCIPIYRLGNSVDAVFSSDESKVALTVSRQKPITDGKRSSREIVVFDLERWKRAPNDSSFLVSLPSEKALTKAVFTVDCSFLACVQYSSDDNKGDHHVGMYSFEKLWSGLRCLNGAELFGESVQSDEKTTKNVVVIDVRAVKDAVLLITIEVERSTQEISQIPLQETHDAPRHRLAVLYDARGDSVLDRIEPFLHPFSNMEATSMLQHGTTFVDDKCNIFKVYNKSCRPQSTIPIGQLKLGIRSLHELCFVLNGRYAVAIVGEGAELVLVRTEDGKEKGRLETHCRATVLAVCSDGRTVLVGSEYGGILAFKVVLDEGDQSPPEEGSSKSPSTRSNLI